MQQQPDERNHPAETTRSACPHRVGRLCGRDNRIEVRRDVITVNLNGVDTAKYTNTDAARGRFSATEATFVGLQPYSNSGFTTAFPRIRATVL